MLSFRTRRAVTGCVATCIALLGGAQSAAAGGYFAGASAEGTRVFFYTTEQLVSADADQGLDIYEWHNGTTSLVSAREIGGSSKLPAYFAAASADGSRVFFVTDERLTSDDADRRADVYEFHDGATKLVSKGPAGGDGRFDAGLAGISADGTQAFIETNERLVADDLDHAADVYRRAGGTTKLLTMGSLPGSGNADLDASFAGASADGSRVFFVTDEPLVPGDLDTQRDLYERSAGDTRLLSTGGSGGNGPFGIGFEGSSDDGSRVFFRTAEQLTGFDTNQAADIYERAGARTTLISRGNQRVGRYGAFFDGASADGSRVFFTTLSPLVPEDNETECNGPGGPPPYRLPCADVYERSGGTTTLISTGPLGGNGPYNAGFDGASTDGSRVFFTTAEALTPDDTDTCSSEPGCYDVYERTGGTTDLVSTGEAGGDGGVAANFAGASGDGTRIFFQTTEPLTFADTDSCPLYGGCNDVYERHGGATTLASTGPLDPQDDESFYRGASEDGTRVFFDTGQALVPQDTNGDGDVYERAGGTTTQISGG